MNLSAFRAASIAAVAILGMVLVAWQFGLLSPNERGSGVGGNAKIGGPFDLLDHNGKPRTNSDFHGQFMLIYFGYSYCPDVCPTALQIMSTALQFLGKKAASVQPIFITVDPKRDTPEHLKDYVKNFYPGMVALTGTEDLIKEVAKRYRIYFSKASQDKTQSNSDDYLIDHSSIVFLMGPDGQYITHFNHQTNAEAMAKIISKQLR
jgi:cytochrome oxidase Cu insertion factor (SCO1/SenC/PrrC family)